jgi:hypothetical protein
MKKTIFITGIALTALLLLFFTLRPESQFSDVKELNLKGPVKYYEVAVFENNIENKNDLWQPTAPDSVIYIEKHYFNKEGMNDSMVILNNSSRKGTAFLYKSKIIYNRNKDLNEDYSKMYDEDSKVTLTTKIKWISGNNYRLSYFVEDSIKFIDEEIWLDKDFNGVKFEKKVYAAYEEQKDKVVQHSVIERFLDKNQQFNKEILYDKILNSTEISGLVIQKKDNYLNPTELVYRKGSKAERLEIRKYEYY